jgi:hypothetical protein
MIKLAMKIKVEDYERDGHAGFDITQLIYTVFGVTLCSDERGLTSPHQFKIYEYEH